MAGARSGRQTRTIALVLAGGLIGAAVAPGIGLAAKFLTKKKADKRYVNETDLPAALSQITQPLAMGTIDADGSVVKATPNVSSVYNDTFQQYEITIAGENYRFLDYLTVVTASCEACYGTEADADGKLVVVVFDDTGVATIGAFDFVTYKIA